MITRESLEQHLRIRCVVYAAKSTEDRRGSIPDQLRECRARILAEPARQVVAEYTDEAFSAFRRNCGPGLVEAMRHVEELVEEGGSAELWAQHSDRLARGDGRSARHAVEIALWALKRDIKVRTVQDPDTFRDLLYAVVTGQRNHEDSQRRGLAISAGRRRAAERGDYIGYLPDGYKLAVAKQMVIDPEREPVIAMIFLLALRGKRVGAISRAINDAGWRAKPARRGEKPLPWKGDRVKGVLENPRYAGLSVVKGEVVARGHWPAYISERQHLRLKVRVAERRPTKRPRQLEPYLLARLGVCGECGAPLYTMTGHQRTDGTFARRYVCASHCRDYHAARCQAAPLNAETLEAMFVASVRTLLLTSEQDEHEDLASQNVPWTSGAERRRVIDSVAGGDDREIDHALELLFTRVSPEAVVLRQLAISQRTARQLEAITHFEAWAQQELEGRSERSRAETRRLNRLLRSWFSQIAISMTASTVTIMAHPRVAGSQHARPKRVCIERSAWMRYAPTQRRPHPTGSAWDHASIIGALQAWADEHRRSPLFSDWRKGGDYHPTSLTVRKHSRTWGSALRRAGLKPNHPRKVGSNWPWPEPDIVQALTRWTAENGRPPTWADWQLATRERPCTETVRKHFGSFTGGLRAAGLT